MYRNLIDFLNNEGCFIEAEGKPQAINKFIVEYNKKYNQHLTVNENGIILLEEDANKWGLELRLYVKTCPPIKVKELGFTHNIAYRNDFSYRLNDNKIVTTLFNNGYRIGYNEAKI